MENNSSVKEYSNGEVTITWEASKCIHSGKCVRGLPSVFDTKKDHGSMYKVLQQRKWSSRFRNVQVEHWDTTLKMKKQKLKV